MGGSCQRREGLVGNQLGLQRVTRKGSGFKDWRGGDGVLGSWAGVRGFSILVGSWARSIRPSAACGSVAELWVGDGVVISWARVGCVPISARSEARGDFHLMKSLWRICQ